MELVNLGQSLLPVRLNCAVGESFHAAPGAPADSTHTSSHSSEAGSGTRQTIHCAICSPSKPMRLVGYDEEAGVRRGDAELSGQVDHFVLELGLLAVQAYLVEQVAHFAPGPDRRDEVMFRCAFGEVYLVSVSELVLAHAAFERQGDVSCTFVSTRHLELFASEQVGKMRRIHF